MVPHFQSKDSAPDGSVKGSCFRTALASITETDPESWPYLEDLDTQWHDPFIDALEKHGYRFSGTYYRTFGEPIRKSDEQWWQELVSISPGIDGYYVVCGLSPRTHVLKGHSVVWKDGKMVHDPHPSNEGLLEVYSAYMIERIPAEDK